MAMSAGRRRVGSRRAGGFRAVRTGYRVFGICSPPDLLGSGNIPTSRKNDPTSLRPRQVWALLAAATRELLWGLPAVSREIDCWRARAEAIPDRPLREDALDALARKRTHLYGAALFWILPQRRNVRLLRLLVAYEIALEFLDNTNERAAHAGQANGRQLHLALVEALNPDAPISDYYRLHPWRDDGGYLRALVESCREHCTCLPSYARVRVRVIREAKRAQVLALNHDPDPGNRETALRQWAAREFPDGEEASWFELSGAATASLTVHVLLALAAEEAFEERDLDSAHAVYFPWCSLATTMLDSYVDQFDDAANDDHSYIAHYAGRELAVRRLCEIVDRTAVQARGLRNGHRHAVIVACMVAMYLSRDSAYTPELRASTRTLVDAGGSLTKLLLPILRTWRIAYGLRSA
jgi:tetraprenyl-beta-curcumene synthase